MVLRLPPEARRVVRRTLRAPRVAAALALALGGVAVAFGIVAFTPELDLAQMLPIAVVITVVARRWPAGIFARPGAPQPASSGNPAARGCSGSGLGSGSVPVWGLGRAWAGSGLGPGPTSSAGGWLSQRTARTDGMASMTALLSSP